MLIFLRNGKTIRTIKDVELKHTRTKISSHAIVSESALIIIDHDANDTKLEIDVDEITAIAEGL